MMQFNLLIYSPFKKNEVVYFHFFSFPLLLKKEGCPDDRYAMSGRGGYITFIPPPFKTRENV